MHEKRWEEKRRHEEKRKNTRITKESGREGKRREAKRWDQRVGRGKATLRQDDSDGMEQVSKVTRTDNPSLTVRIDNDARRKHNV